MTKLGKISHQLVDSEYAESATLSDKIVVVLWTKTQHCNFAFRGPLARCAASQVRRPVVACLWGFYWSGTGRVPMRDGRDATGWRGLSVRRKDARRSREVVVG